MQPLIEIQTIPIEIQMKVTNARLEYARGTARMEITRDKGGLQIRSEPIQVNIDTFGARNSVVPTTMRSIEQSAQSGRQAAYQATASISREGKMMMQATVDGEVIPNLAREAMLQRPANLNIQFLPSAGANIAWDGGEMSIQYEMDKLNFDWRMEQLQMTFVPGDIEFTMTQRPEVIIKYVGGPLYVPPSADPDYEPVDVQA